MRILVVLACLMGLFGAFPAHASGLEDVFGREVPLGQGRPAVVLYANRDTRQVLREHAMRFAYELRHENPIVVVHVDLRGIPGFFMGAASREIRKIHRDSLDKVRQLFLEQGQQPPDDLEASFYMVADSSGEPHSALGLVKGFQQVLIQAMSPSGLELARGPFPQASETIRQVLEARAR
ncbi:hypothetical protein JQX13_40470 [Archangium violaceum]|uniref:hypothetical protein n=1 Tax=Archangium violaceum TaxID=83451 RepID=UPI00193AF39D|nr:hypothetical protein [Archangium violaceum]QRK06322.1 hypothetical protein JQX13_40470 [Archangium violaceum]